MPRSYEEMKRRIEQTIAEIDEDIIDTGNRIKEQVKKGYMTPDLLELFIELINITISLMDDRIKLAEYAKILEIDIQ